MISRVGAIALAASLAVIAPAAAGATNVSGSQLRALASRAAQGDPQALTQLREIDRVDGRSAHVAAALDTGNASELRSRSTALASGGPSSESSAARAQQTAATILGSRRYGQAPLPDPIAAVFHKVGRFLDRLAAGAPGGPVIFWAVLGAVVLALAGFGARRMVRRLDPVAAAAATSAAGSTEDPALLEQQAQAAEAGGRFGDAVRLRFRAGLLQLSFRGAFEYRPSLLTTEVRRTLRSSEFDALARSFEQVAYGGVDAAENDAAAARDGWRSLLASTPRR